MMSPRFERDRRLIGTPASRWAIDTPALVLDLDAFERNLDRMAAHCRAKEIGLRPHSKSHKCAEIARRQIASGALGQCCGKLGEAEALAEAGIDSFLLTSPVVTASGIARLMKLAARVRLAVAADSLANVGDLAAAALEACLVLDVVIDLDVGLHRTGACVDSCVEIARAVDSQAALNLLGLQAYAGHLMHVEGRDERRSRSLAAMEILRSAAARLSEAGLTARILTGAGTGTYDIDPEANVLTEIQAGSYVFMDRQYNDVWKESAPPFETALFVQSTVISANTPGLATIDAGYKSFATDAGVPDVVSGAPEGTSYFFFGDEHGGLALPEGRRLDAGTVVVCNVPHCDPTVNLYDAYHVVRGDVLVDLWRIDARGRSD
ncbi:MAG TPA: DSD1 family PLP-dependent enzyme [Allosphingosinicella sp.]|jgi:D-serine deaminase-like pyridoxal phosphate-dependent protein